MTRRPDIDIGTLVLEKGSHAAPNGDFHACVMEAVAYVAGEPWGDRPKCTCPAIIDFMISWNDALPNDAERTRLLMPLIPLMIGTRSTKSVVTRRRWLAFDWMVREFTSAWMDLSPTLAPHAAALRGLPEVNAESVTLMPVLQEARSTSAAAWDAARAAAWDAARDAAWAAAWDAAWAAAGDAARDAARDALAPTVARVQDSAVDLVRRMCVLTEAA